MPTDLSSVSFYVAILDVFQCVIPWANTAFHCGAFVSIWFSALAYGSTSSSVNSSFERKLDILSVFQKYHAVIYLRSFLMLKEQ